MIACLKLACHLDDERNVVSANLKHRSSERYERRQSLRVHSLDCSYK